jgi:hypothetical protein
MRQVMARHDALLTQVFELHDGVVVRPRGEGDSLFAVFVRASDAVVATLAAQRALLAEDWGAIGPLHVRMALHTGEADRRDGNYYGSTVNRCARIRAAGHGGQVLLSEPAALLALGALPNGVGLRELGRHRLKDLTEPERLFQLLAPELPDTFPPLKTLDAQPHNLPLQLTRFIGREQQLAALAHRFAATRLLTLTGAGGCGKTRLALQTAAELVDDFADGVWLVDLAPLTDPALVPQMVAAVLGVREQPGRPLLATLTAALRHKTLLLLLDNCEHLIAACARLADTLLRSCPGLHILATSREALRITGETAWPVPSLGVPPY